MASRRAPIAALLVFGAFVAGVASARADTGRQWDFRVTLDDQPIGDHLFSSIATGSGRQVTSEASFVVRFLGIVAYRYRHQAIEQWRGNCLTGLAATTEENGKTSRVRADAVGTAAAPGDTPTQPLDGCVMSFAYWNPAILKQTRLFNAQTGRTENVQLKPQGNGSIDVRGEPMLAARWRITGPEQPIDLWYSPEGEWVGLDSTVSGGRRLSYRLK